jgi:hypothetical protein
VLMDESTVADGQDPEGQDERVPAGCRASSPGAYGTERSDEH